MIHNISDEREKRYWQDAPLPDSFSEEELLRFIGQVEERELIHAPGHLKEDVFRRIDRQRKQERNRRLFSYRVQVLAGMAAALMLLLLLPAERQATSDRTGFATIIPFLRGEETTGADEWEQAALERKQDIDRVWERYQKQQERKDAGERYLQEVKDYFTNNFEWED